MITHDELLSIQKKRNMIVIEQLLLATRCWSFPDELLSFDEEQFQTVASNACIYVARFLPVESNVFTKKLVAEKLLHACELANSCWGSYSRAGIRDINAISRIVVNIMEGIAPNNALAPDFEKARHENRG